MSGRNSGQLPSGERYVAAEANEFMARALARFEPVLRRTARQLTADPDLREDLVQEGRVRLWELDPTRFDLRRVEDVGYLCRALINRMRRVWKAEMARCIR